jgi:hypothetical protein
MTTYHVASEQSAERVIAHIRALAGKEAIVVSVEKPKRLRSIKANARYWVLLTLIADHIKPEGRHHDKETWHEYFRRRILEPLEIVLPNGKTILEYPSTSDLSAEGFRDFATQVEVWANERGVVMPEFGE